MSFKFYKKWYVNIKQNNLVVPNFSQSIFFKILRKKKSNISILEFSVIYFKKSSPILLAFKSIDASHHEGAIALRCALKWCSLTCRQSALNCDMPVYTPVENIIH